MLWLVLFALASMGFAREESVWSANRFPRPHFVPLDKLPALDSSKRMRRSEFGTDGQSRIHVVESLPVGDFDLKPISQGFNTAEALIAVIDAAKEHLDILAMYWNLNGTSDREVYSPDQMKAFGADFGMNVLHALQRAATRKVRIRVVGSKSDRFTTTEIQSLTKDIRLWDSTYWYGGGIMHQKMIVADQKHAYIGSANMDWKSLSQVMELGVVIESSPAVVSDMQHLFNLWWAWSDPAMTLSYRPLNHYSNQFQATLRLPPWSPEIPIALQEPNPFNNSNMSSLYNKENNLLCFLNGKKAQMFLSASPIAATSWARTFDEDSLIYTLRSAKKMVDLSVMDFVPFATYPIDTHKQGSIYWSALTDTILSVIYARNVRVRLLISHWQHTDPVMLLSLQHLQSQSKLCPRHGMSCLGSLEIRLFQVPFWNATDPIPSKYPPFTRVNHAKYIVSDVRVNIGTSNMEWGYFYNTAGASFNTDHPDTIAAVQAVFQRNWDSPPFTRSHGTVSPVISQFAMGRNDLPHPVSDEEWALRCELAAAYRLFHKFGWDEVIYGHLTVRVPNGTDDADVDNAHFLINPLGLRYDEICASNLVTIDIKGNYINRGSTGWDINHAGYVIHSCIHECRHDMKCVMHCHTVEGSAVSSMKFGLLPISQLSHVAMSAGVSYHDYEGLAVSEAEKPRLKADLGPDNKLFILRNHGLLTGGATIAEAFFWMYYAVHACKIQVAALSAGIENVSYASEEVANKFKIGLQTFTKKGVGADMFNALKRSLPLDYTN